MKFLKQEKTEAVWYINTHKKKFLWFLNVKYLAFFVL